MKWLVFSFCSILMIGCEIKDNFQFAYKPVNGGGILSNVLKQIDTKNPGRGLADYPSDDLSDVPKSYAMILLGAVADASNKKSQNINELGVAAGNWLIENSDANDDGVVGWGVPIAWDAYGDGSINPENTEYSISTAIVVDALMGWVEYVDDEKKVLILRLVEKSLEPYLSQGMRTPAGLLPYSLLSHDRRYDTFNSAVYLAGQMQRYSLIVNDGETKEKLRSAADETMSALLKNKKRAPKSKAWYWDYSIQEQNPNDLPHAGYIAEGVLTYIHSNGRLASQFNIDQILSHLFDFVDTDGKVRGWPIFRPEISTPPRLYDLSIAAQLMCRFRTRDDASIFLGHISEYELPSGGYTKYPNGTKGNRQVAEYEAYLYRALMACGYGSVENDK